MPPTAPGWHCAPRGAALLVAVMLVQSCFPISELHLPSLISTAQPEIAGLRLLPLQESSGGEQWWDLKAVLLPSSCWLSCWQKGQAKEFIFADMTRVAQEFVGDYKCLCRPVRQKLQRFHPSLRQGSALARLECVSKHLQARECLKHPAREKRNPFC